MAGRIAWDDDAPGRRGLVPEAMMRTRLASGAWLEPPLVTFAAGFMVAGTVLAIGALLLTGSGTLDAFNRPLGTDFSSFWSAGRMALDGQAAAAYDWQAHFQVQQRTHGIDDYFPWSYPPTFILLAALVALLPYVPALIAWQATSAAAAGIVFWNILPSCRALMIAAGFPAVLICLGHGQTGFLSAALIAGGVLALRRHEILAGVLFGLLAYKPQLGILIPAVLIAGRYWRAILSGAVTVALSASVTLALWGWPVWQAFFDSVTLTRTVVFEAGDTGFHKFQSIFAWARLWGGSIALGYTLQAAVTLASTLLCIRVWLSDVSLQLKGAALLTGAMLSSPYVLDYDLVVFGMALAFLTAHALERGFYPWEKTLIAVAWFTPMVARSLAQTLLLPAGFLVLAAVFGMTVLRARREHAESGLRSALPAIANRSEPASAAANT